MHYSASDLRSGGLGHLWSSGFQSPRDGSKEAQRPSFNFFLIILKFILGLPGGSDGKESTCNAGDLGTIPGLGRSLERGQGSPLQYSCLVDPHGQRSLEGCSPWGCRVGHDWVTKHSTAQSLFYYSYYKDNTQDPSDRAGGSIHGHSILEDSWATQFKI